MRNTEQEQIQATASQAIDAILTLIEQGQTYPELPLALAILRKIEVRANEAADRALACDEILGMATELVEALK